MYVFELWYSCDLDLEETSKIVLYDSLTYEFFKLFYIQFAETDESQIGYFGEPDNKNELLKKVFTKYQRRFFQCESSIISSNQRVYSRDEKIRLINYIAKKKSHFNMKHGDIVIMKKDNSKTCFILTDSDAPNFKQIKIS